MKVPSGLEWYNVIILVLAAIGVLVNIYCLIVLTKKNKCSMFYKNLKVSKKSFSIIFIKIEGKFLGILRYSQVG